MSATRVLPALAAALAAWAAPASAFDWSGQVGLQYLRNDAWAPGYRTTAPHLDLNLGLQLGGAVVRRDLATYSLGADYQRVTDGQTGRAESVRDSLRYRARATLFTSRAPMSGTLHADRGDDSLDPGDPQARGFRFESQSFGGTLAYHQIGRPGLSAGYTRSESLSRLPVQDVRRTIETVNAGTTYGGPAFTYSARWAGTFSDGTYASDDFENHRVDVRADARVDEAVDARTTASYYLRTPRAGVLFSPRQEVTSLQAMVSHSPPGRRGDLHRAIYAYGHGLQGGAGLADTENTAHRLSYSLSQHLPHPDWQLRGGVGAGLTILRLAEEERRDAGQDLSLTALWQHAWKGWGDASAYAGPTVGVLEPHRAATEMGYGGAAGAAINRFTAGANLGAGYDVGYASDIGQKGTSFRQQLRGSVDGRLWAGTARAQLTAAAERRDTPFHGATGSRSLALNGSYGWRRYSASVGASLSSGVANAVANPAFGDGMFLALPYDSHSYALTAGLVAGLTRALSLSASGRYGATDLPGRPTSQETEGRGVIAYTIGAFRVSAEDRYVVTTIGGETLRTNLFLVTAYRRFGSRY